MIWKMLEFMNNQEEVESGSDKRRFKYEACI